MSIVLIDSNERKTQIILSDIPKEVSRLKVGDLLFPTNKVLWEFKVENDAHDYKRASDEFTRMNYPEYLGFEKHLGYLGDGLWNYRLYEEMRKFVFGKAGYLPYIIKDNTIALLSSLFKQFHEYKILVDFCVRSNIFPHHFFSEDRFVESVKKSLRGEYAKPLQNHSTAKKDGGLLFREIRCFPGITEETAFKLVPIVRRYRWGVWKNWDFEMAVIEILGRKINEEPTKLAMEFCHYIETGVEP